MGPRFPEVHVTLRSENRWAVASAVRQALRRAGKDRSEIDRFEAEAMAAIGAPDPEQLRQVCQRWVELSPSAG